MIERVYYELERAAEMLKTDSATLLHAAGMGQVTLCVNIYGRACGLEMDRLHDAEVPALEQGEEMPDGVFEIFDDAARFLEEYPDEDHELSEAGKLDHRGWWHVSFDPPVPIRATDIVLMKSELARLKTQREKAGATERQPDRTHVSDWLALLNQASRKWWANADRCDPTTHPAKSDVVAWLVDGGMNESLAKHAATIIRPAWGHVGRKPGV